MQAALSKVELLKGIYRRATKIKQNDERFRAVIKSGRISATYYSPRGQEIIPSAVSACLGPTDYVCTIYRGVHDMIAQGVPLNLLWAEIAGKATGTCKGKGGSMHVTHPASGVMITTGIVGSSMPIANGLALASKIRNEKRVAVAYFGDGASNIGAFHESLNLASVWRLPVIFVCQNNRFAEHTRMQVATAVDRIADRAAAYRMPGFTVDGNDASAMYEVAKAAVDRARNGEGPTLIEAMTFRFCGHVFGDMDSYMDKSEREEALSRDPVVKLRSWLIENGHANVWELESMEAVIEKEIDAAVEFALASPDPDASELRRDVFSAELSL